jgi:hypothetical protein
MIRVSFHPDAGHPQRIVRAEAFCNGCERPLAFAMNADAVVAIEAVALAGTEFCVGCRPETERAPKTQ